VLARQQANLLHPPRRSVRVLFYPRYILLCLLPPCSIRFLATNITHTCHSRSYAFFPRSRIEHNTHMHNTHMHNTHMHNTHMHGSDCGWKAESQTLLCMCVSCMCVLCMCVLCMCVRVCFLAAVAVMHVCLVCVGWGG